MGQPAIRTGLTDGRQGVLRLFPVREDRHCSSLREFREVSPGQRKIAETPIDAHTELMYIQKCVLVGCAKGGAESQETRRELRRSGDRVRRFRGSRLGGRRTLDDRSPFKTAGRVIRRKNSAGCVYDTEVRRWQGNDPHHQRAASEPQRAQSIPPTGRLIFRIYRNPRMKS